MLLEFCKFRIVNRHVQHGVWKSGNASCTSVNEVTDNAIPCNGVSVLCSTGRCGVCKWGTTRNIIFRNWCLRTFNTKGSLIISFHFLKQWQFVFFLFFFTCTCLTAASYILLQSELLVRRRRGGLVLHEVFEAAGPLQRELWTHSEMRLFTDHKLKAVKCRGQMSFYLIFTPPGKPRWD